MENTLRNQLKYQTISKLKLLFLRKNVDWKEIDILSKHLFDLNNSNYLHEIDNNLRVFIPLIQDTISLAFSELERRGDLLINEKCHAFPELDKNFEKHSESDVKELKILDKKFRKSILSLFRFRISSPLKAGHLPKFFFSKEEFYVILEEYNEKRKTILVNHEF